MADIRSAKVEVIDSVASAYRLFTALNDDPTLAEFNFISNWPEHSLDKKKELYKNIPPTSCTSFGAKGSGIFQ